MIEFIKKYWNECLAVAALVISIVTLFQNRKLHNDNKKLTVLPNLDVKFLFDERIRVNVVKKEDVVGAITVLQSKYADYYTNHDLHFDKGKALFSVLITNNGLGVAKNIVYNQICVFLENKKIVYNSNDIIFTCSQGETKANKIYINHQPSDIKKIVLMISYEDILEKKHTIQNTYEPLNDDLPEMKLLKSTKCKTKRSRNCNEV